MLWHTLTMSKISRLEYKLFWRDRRKRQRLANHWLNIMPEDGLARVIFWRIICYNIRDLLITIWIGDHYIRQFKVWVNTSFMAKVIESYRLMDLYVRHHTPYVNNRGLGVNDKQSFWWVVMAPPHCDIACKPRSCPVPWALLWNTYAEWVCHIQATWSSWVV